MGKLNKRIVKSSLVGVLLASILFSFHLSFATVGISGTTNSTNTSDESSDEVLDVDLTSSSNTNGGLEDIDNTSEDGISYDPYAVGSENSESSEINNANMTLYASLQESWDENPGGSTYTDEYAYYKIGGLSEQPAIHAPAAIIMDATSGVVLYNKSASEKKYPASMTKVMTAILAIENGNLDDVITFSDNAVNGLPKDMAVAGFSVGDQVTLREALYALFMTSAADATLAIAEYIGGDETNFVSMMNEKAQSLGCANTNFVNCHGYHDANHYTTSYDMALIMQYAIQNPDFREIINTKKYTVEKRDNIAKEIVLQNRMAFFSENNQNRYDPVIGAKTGHTDAAKYTLTSFAEKNDETLIVVVMEEENFDNAYADSKTLYEWAYKKTQVLYPMPDTSSIEYVLQSAMTDSKFERLRLLSLQYMPNYSILTNTSINKDAIKSFFVMDEDMENGILGYLNVSYYDKVLIGRTPIIYDTTTDGYNEYLSYYSTNVTTEPIEGESNIILPTDSSNSEDETIDIGNNEQEVDRFEEEPNFDSSILEQIVQLYIVYGMAMIILCMVTYLVIIIRRRNEE